MKGSLMVAVAASVVIIGVIAYKACDTDTAAETDLNIYHDASLRQIYDLRVSGKTVDLMKYSTSQYPALRKAAMQAVGSTKDSGAVLSVLHIYSTDPDIEVRSAALFALGTIGSRTAEKYLLQSDFNSQPDEVKSAFIYAISRCGGPKSLDFIEKLDFASQNVMLVSAQCSALSYMAKRGLYSSNASQKAIKYVCDNNIHEGARTLAAEYFVSCNSDFSLYTDEFIKAYQQATQVCYKSNLMIALGKCHNARAFNFLKKVLQNPDNDSRIMQNAIVAFQNYPYYDCKPIIQKLLNSSNDKVASQAALFFLNKGIPGDSTMYWDLCHNITNWNTRSFLYAAALKYSNNKSYISRCIRDGLSTTPVEYEKAALLHALTSDLNNVDFLDSEEPYIKSEMIRTERLKVIADMYESPQFPEFVKSKKAEGKDMMMKFFLIFKNALVNGNHDMMTIAASMFARHPEIYMDYQNSFFFKQAFSKCVFPRDADLYLALVKASNAVNGPSVSRVENPLQDTINWSYITKLPSLCDVVVTTNKGQFTIRTDINNAPIAVSSFLKLVEENYYSNTAFRINQPDMLTNIGSISEFDENKQVMLPLESTPYTISEGTVTLAVSPFGHSYSTKWNIVLNPSAISTGSASVIGTVIDGMNVVNSLNTGDMIKSMKIK